MRSIRTKRASADADPLGEHREQLLDVRRQRLPFAGVPDGDRLRELVADPDVVDDEPVQLLLAGVRVRPAPVRARDRLEQRVRPQRLVEVHDALDRRVEAGEQLRRDDEEA